MSTIIVKKDISPKYINLLLHKFNSEKLRLRLPFKIRIGGGLGLEAMLIQAISTWARSQDQAALHTYVKYDSKEIGFRDFSETFYGMCALALSSEIYCDDGIKRVPKSEAMLPAKEKSDLVSKLMFRDAYKGFKVACLSLKSGGSNGLNRPLYNNSALVGQAAFEDVLEAAINATIPGGRKKLEMSDESVRDVAFALRQIFKNADQHANADHQGNEYKRNAKGIIFNKTSVRQSDADLIFDSHRGKEYASRFFDDAAKLETKSFFEISIFDSGPGFASRWLSKPYESISEREEIESIVKCFILHFSSKSSDADGGGLYAVLKVLSRTSGYLRLRTGRCLVEKYFDLQGEKSLIIDRGDINCGLPIVAGTVVTLVFPLFKGGKNNVCF